MARGTADDSPHHRRSGGGRPLDLGTGGTRGRLKLAKRKGGRICEDRAPVVPDTYDRPTAAGGQLERPFGAGNVVELASPVVVPEEELERSPVLAGGVVQHGDIAVGVAGRQDGSPADPGPDPHRLGGAVVE